MRGLMNDMDSLSSQSRSARARSVAGSHHGPQRRQRHVTVRQQAPNVQPEHSDAFASFQATRMRKGVGISHAKTQKPDDTSFFALPADSGLSRYIHSMRVSVQNQAGHLFEREPLGDRGGDRSNDSAASSDVFTNFSRTMRPEPVSRVRSIFGIVGILALAAILFTQTGLTGISIAFWLFTIGLFIWRGSARIAIGCALVCLLLVVTLLICAQVFGQTSPEGGFRYWAEQAAVWAYLFLVIGVIRQIWEYMVQVRRN